MRVSRRTIACSTRRSRNRQPLTWTLVVSRKPAMCSVADVQTCVDAVDGGGHVFAIDLAELFDAEGVEVERACQAHIASLLAGLHQLACVPAVACDVESGLVVEGALTEQG